VKASCYRVVGLACQLREQKAEAISWYKKSQEILPAEDMKRMIEQLESGEKK
jgi:hypothetical protein